MVLDDDHTYDVEYITDVGYLEGCRLLYNT